MEDNTASMRYAVARHIMDHHGTQSLERLNQMLRREKLEDGWVATRKQLMAVTVVETVKVAIAAAEQNRLLDYTYAVY